MAAMENDAPKQNTMDEIGLPYKDSFGKEIDQPKMSSFVASSTGNTLAVYRWDGKLTGVQNKVAKTTGQVVNAAENVAQKALNVVGAVAGGIHIPGFQAKVEGITEAVAAKVEGALDQVDAKVHKLRSAKGTIVLVHGFAEHLGRYCHVAGYFAAQGFDVVGIDHASHGRSQGSGSYYLRSFQDLVSDWTEFVMAEVAPTASGAHFVYAHSTGCTVSLLALEKGLAAKWTNLKGVTFSAPLLSPAKGPMKLASMCPGCINGTLSLPCCCQCCLATRCLPGITAGQLSTFSKAENATRKDSLYWGWRVNLSVVRALTFGTSAVKTVMDTPAYPLLLLQAEKDALVDPAMTRKLFEQAATSQKRLETDPFKEFAHELHNHEDWQRPLNIAAPWFDTLLEPADGARA